MNYPSRNRRIVYLAIEVCLYTFHGIHGIPSIRKGVGFRKKVFDWRKESDAYISGNIQNRVQ